MITPVVIVVYSLTLIILVQSNILVKDVTISEGENIDDPRVIIDTDFLLKNLNLTYLGIPLVTTSQSPDTTTFHSNEATTYDDTTNLPSTTVPTTTLIDFLSSDTTGVTNTVLPISTTSTSPYSPTTTSSYNDTGHYRSGQAKINLRKHKKIICAKRRKQTKKPNTLYQYNQFVKFMLDESYKHTNDDYWRQVVFRCWNYDLC